VRAPAQPGSTGRFRRDLAGAGPSREQFDVLVHVRPLAPRDLAELARILDSLIQANQNHDPSR